MTGSIAPDTRCAALTFGGTQHEEGWADVVFPELHVGDFILFENYLAAGTSSSAKIYEIEVYGFEKIKIKEGARSLNTLTNPDGTQTALASNLGRIE